MWLFELAVQIAKAFQADWQYLRQACPGHDALQLVQLLLIIQLRAVHFSPLRNLGKVHHCLLLQW